MRGAAAAIVGDAEQRFIHLAPLDTTQVDEEATVSYAIWRYRMVEYIR